MVISSILWIPAGIPDPNPKKYDSKYTDNNENIEYDDNDEIDDDNNDDDNRVQSSSQKSNKTKKNKNKDNAEDDVRTSELSLLPPELRMDEYSDDDDDDKGMKLGKLLIGNYDGDADFIEEEEDDEEEEPGNNNKSHPNKHVDKTRNKKVKENDDDETADEDEDMERISNDGTDDDEDDLHDVPDTREYMPVDVEALQSMKIGGGSGGISNKMVIRRDENGDIDDDDIDDDDSASEIEDTKIMEHDAMIIVAKTEDDDYPLLEIHIYDTMSGNLYVHHDIPLPSYPLCLAHGRIGGKTNNNTVLGNYCAVGTFNPTIEIWNLDVLNPIEPSCILGTNNNQKNKKHNNNNKNNNNNNNNTHTDAILSLSWNTYHQNVLASGSADYTIKLWDIQTEKVASTLYHHTNKVQSLQWNPIESTLLASGSYDHTISLIDARTCSNSGTSKNNNNNNNSNSVKSVNITSDCECISWDPNKNELLTVIEENGYMTCWDVRQFNTSTPLWKYKHSIGITEMSYNQHIPGLLVTSNIDKNITLWDTYTMSTTNTADALLTRNSYIPVQKQPKCIITKDMCAGKLYNVSFYSSLPWLLACGGSGNTLSLWDLSDETSINSLFTERCNVFHNNNNTITSSSLVEQQQEQDVIESITATTSIPALTKDSTDMNNKNDNDIDHNDNDMKKTKKNKKPKAKKNKAHKSGR